MWKNSKAKALMKFASAVVKILHIIKIVDCKDLYH